MSILATAKERRREAPEGLVFQTLQAAKDATIRYAYQEADERRAKGTVIFVPGRTEFIEKFVEDMHVWNAFGFSVGAIDLRGQGLSTRPGPSREKHHVESFDDHIDDLHLVVEAIGKAGSPKPFYLMAHSAGGHVTLRYLHQHIGQITRAFMTAPMIGIANGGLPAFLVRSLPGFMDKVGLGAAYVPGHKAFKYGQWGWRKQLTHDMDRFEDEDYFINEKESRLAVGGATYRWVKEALDSCEKLTAGGVAESIRTPYLILQAGMEGIVDNAAQDAFVARSSAGRLAKIDGAKHEIMKETDDKRLKMWTEIAQDMALDTEQL